MAAPAGLSFGAAAAGYEEDPQAKLCNEVCVTVFQKLHAARRGLPNNVFEIGAGTGGTSCFVIPTLDPQTTRYIFTDLSQVFLSNARARFADYPFMEYAIFDADIHPANQGFHSHEMHQVLASNVIHATKHLAATMFAIHLLLAPGGHIVFNEVHTAGLLVEDLTFGLTDGWWMLTDTERRTTYPLMKTPKWCELFTACGFKNVWHTPDEGPIFSQQSVMVARTGEGPHMQRTFEAVDPCLRMDPAASYLITGAVGGLGLISALILIDRGARYLHFVSRRDRVPAEAADLYAKVASSNCTIRRERCNIASNKEVSRLFRDVAGVPPCQGYIHGAGVLSDGLILRQSRKKYEDVFAPKHFGAWNLHCASSHKVQKMQLCVMFSSAAGFLGNAGQSNHGAANAGIDALAAMNCCLGMPGASISWGPVAEVGYAARHGHARDDATKVRIEHAWLALEAIQAMPFSHVLIVPNAHLFGVGAPPIRAATYAGAAARFRPVAAKRPARPAAPAAQQGPQKGAEEAEQPLAVVPAPQDWPAPAPAGDAAAPHAGASDDHREVVQAMLALHEQWQAGGPFAEKLGLAPQRAGPRRKAARAGGPQPPQPRLGEQEVC